MKTEIEGSGFKEGTDLPGTVLARVVDHRFQHALGVFRINELEHLHFFELAHALDAARVPPG